MDGYYENEAATNAVFFGEYYRTGDLGYFADGELYVCGRSKDMVIVAGRNYYPTDIEVAASEVAGVRKGNLVAFGVEEEDGSETVVLCVETREEKTEYERMTAQIRSAVMTSIGVSIAEIVFLPPGTLPKTSSGKLQRGKAKMRFLEGTLDSRQNIRRKSDNLGLLKHWAVSQWSFLRNK